jgi:hypothetical protein
MSTQKKDPREIITEAFHQVDELLEPTNHKDPKAYDYQGPTGALSVWLTDNEAGSNGEESGLLHTVMTRFCAILGHAPEMDQCGKPAHDFCGFCRASTPGEAPGRPARILDTIVKGIEDPEFDPSKPYHGLKAPE